MIELELGLLWASIIVYTAAGVTAIVGALMGRRPERTVLMTLILALLLQTGFFALRWVRLDHGPFSSQFEILASNLWSLMLVFTLVYWRIRAIRPAAAVIAPVMFLMMAWLVVVGPYDTQLPPTYDTIWLFIHIGFGKVFLGAMFVAVALSGAIVLRRLQIRAPFLRQLPGDYSLEELAYRFVAIALVFNTLMLIAGGIWAQDAWGRYWAWDPLETWSLITWLLLGVALHIRLTLKPRPLRSAVLVLGIFVVAFVNFFGIPFVTQIPHGGVL